MTCTTPLRRGVDTTTVLSFPQIPKEWMSKRIVQQIADVPVPQIPEQIVEVILGSCGSLAKARATARLDEPTTAGEEC